MNTATQQTIPASKPRRSSAQGIHASQTARPGEVQISVHGRFDYSMLNEFRAAYEDRPEFCNYVVDLSRSDGLQLSAIGMLLAFQRWVSAHGKRIALRGLDHRFAGILDQCGLRDMFCGTGALRQA